MSNSDNSQNPFILRSQEESHRRVISRKSKENRFRLYGFLSVITSILFLGFLLFTILGTGLSGFYQTKIKFDIDVTSKLKLDNSKIVETIDPEKAKFRNLINDKLKRIFPNAKRRSEIIDLYTIPSRNAYIFAEQQLQEFINDNSKRKISEVFNQLENFEIRFPASSDIDIFYKNKFENYDPDKDDKYISDFQLEALKKLEDLDMIKKSFNWRFFKAGDSREAELAGIWGSLKGSFYVLFVCMLVALPLGIATAIYLEEFAPRNKIKNVVETLINNLAAIPSIVYGLLGLAIYLNFVGLQRSSALAGGLTLALLVLPIIIVSARNSLGSVPPSIKDAAIGLGASKTQVVFHHVLPLSLPGIMTGSILSMARALGETAPLLMIGMVAFVKDVPQKITDPSTALPVQIYIWSDLPEKGFAEKTSAAIIVLLLFLVLANLIAVYLRKKFEYKW
jgi:phosphate transport system permease protein